MISFIIPVFNKGRVLFPMLERLVKTLTHSPFADYEIIIVNDGSTDNSFEEAVRFKKLMKKNTNIQIYHYRENIGKGFALRFGFYKSSGQTVCFLDGDMDIAIDQVIAALETFDVRSPDMVIGSKYHPQSRYHYPVIRTLYSQALKTLIKLFFHLSVSDTQVGMKIFRREVLTEILPKLIIKRFATDLELLVVAHMYGFTHIIESPVTISIPHVKNSSINIWAVKNFCQDILAIFYRRYILQFYTQKQSSIPTFGVSVEVA